MARRTDDLSRLDGSNPPIWLKILIFLITAGVAFGLYYLVQWLYSLYV